MKAGLLRFYFRRSFLRPQPMRVGILDLSEWASTPSWSFEIENSTLSLPNCQGVKSPQSPHELSFSAKGRLNTPKACWFSPRFPTKTLSFSSNDPNFSKHTRAVGWEIRHSERGWAKPRQKMQFSLPEPEMLWAIYDEEHEHQVVLVITWTAFIYHLTSIWCERCTQDTRYKVVVHDDRHGIFNFNINSCAYYNINLLIKLNLDRNTVFSITIKIYQELFLLSSWKDVFSFESNITNLYSRSHKTCHL